MLHTVLIDKLVHGGQGLGALPDGRRIFVWNALPGETVGVRVAKSKNKYAEGIAEDIIEPSADRIKPKDEAYLSTSPWQILAYESENKYKNEILTETFVREKVKLPQTIGFYASEQQWRYRNKMEYSFWADDDGLHLALFHRGSRGKRIVAGSSIARPEIDKTANKICQILHESGIRGSQLKTLVVRCDQRGSSVAAIFVKDASFANLPQLEAVCQGTGVYFSDPKSPASVLSKELYVYGNVRLTDSILGSDICYDVHSFFQVNVPMFEQAAKQIQDFVGVVKPAVDFYSGVGTIGIPIGATVLIESEPHNVSMAKQNIAKRPIDVVQATAEKALDYIPSKGALVVDPPRAGLHPKVIERIREACPNTIVYLSCNPITQARDVALLQDLYELKTLKGYNLFPRTPHIESLAVLVRYT
ncbi:MAG TPA: TRAM domain-containing protein [Candidatus Limnocylindrales bacterium]|nr:TRAM domain-containing protein [Candidatus Limnocylindrales bacterium]